jgi:hypothetical protein
LISIILNLNFEITTECFVTTLIRHDNGDATLFYTEKGQGSSIVSFDIAGNVLNKHIKISNGQDLSAKKMQNGYCMRFNKNQASSISFNGNSYDCDRNSSHITVLTDNNFNYLSHKPITMYYTGCNKSNFVYIDEHYDYYFCDLELNVVPGRSMSKIKEQFGRTVTSLELNEKHIFFLCETKKLKIFDIETFDLVKEIETSADRIKLASIEILILFDSEERMVYFYNQSEDFDFLDEFYLGDVVHSDFFISRDKTEYLTFFNSRSASFKSVKLD